MKNCVALVSIGCFCFAALAFAQKPESTDKLVDLLPLGTCALLELEETGSYSIEIVDKNAKQEDLHKALFKEIDELSAKGGEADKAAGDFWKKFLSDPTKDSTIYIVTSVGSDYLLFRPKAKESSRWTAVPFHSIGAISDRDMTLSK